MTHSFLESDTRLGAQHSIDLKLCYQTHSIASDRGTQIRTVSAVSIVACGCINCEYAVGCSGYGKPTLIHPFYTHQLFGKSVHELLWRGDLQYL
jgi:hypothetical protein